MKCNLDASKKFLTKFGSVSVECGPDGRGGPSFVGRCDIVGVGFVVPALVLVCVVTVTTAINKHNK